MVVPESARLYLQRLGLAPVDVPRVIATFMAAKYGTLSLFVCVGARWRPLTSSFQKCVGRNRKAQMDMLRMSIPRFQRRVQRMGESTRHKMERRKEDVKRRLQDIEVYQRWMTWYLTKSGKLATSIAQNPWWESVVRTVTSRSKAPKEIATGAAEGLFLCKLTAPIHVPLVFWLSAMFWKSRRALECAALEGGAAEEGEPSPRDAAAADREAAASASTQDLTLYKRYCRVHGACSDVSNENKACE